MSEEGPQRQREAPSTIVPAASSIVAALMEEARRAAASGRRALARQRYESALFLLREPAEGIVASAILRRIGRTYLDDGDFAAGLDCLAAARAVAEAWNDPGEIAHTITRRLRGLEHRFEDLVKEWAQSIESKDAYTLGHCERVADYACAIATEMGFDQTQLFWFRVGALLHDVGKIIVPVDILNKAGPLTPDERREMEKHPVAGVELLRDIEFPWDVVPMIRGHHERWDGHGYPDRLAGEDIPLAARILCVADVYDALTSHRPYRRAHERDHALRLMASDTGRQFDPDILPRFFRIVTTPSDPNAQAEAGVIGEGTSHRGFRLTPVPARALA